MKRLMYILENVSGDCNKEHCGMYEHCCNIRATDIKFLDATETSYYEESPMLCPIGRIIDDKNKVYLEAYYPEEHYLGKRN